MIRKSIPLQPVTFRALQRLLLRVGFTKTVLTEPDAFFFAHPASGTTLILPPGNPGDILPPLAALTARRTLLEKGIVTPGRYAVLLAQAGRVPRQVQSLPRGRRPASDTTDVLSPFKSR